MKMKQIQNNIMLDGEIPMGTYIVEGELKVARFFYKGGVMNSQLFKTYHNGETLNLNQSGRYYCVFYEKLNCTYNIKNIEGFLHRISPSQKLSFLSAHYKALKDFILKEHLEEFYLKWIFKMKEEPERLEVWKGDNHVLNLSQETSNYSSNPKDFRLVSYIY